MPSAIALVVAAGRGQRMRGETPKQYMNLGGKSVLRWALEAFTTHPLLDEVRVVIHPDHREFYDLAVEGLKLMDPVEGGNNRQGSVKNGLESLTEDAPQAVLIHDGARPFVQSELINRILRAHEKAPAVIPALPVVDTLKKVKKGKVNKTVSRADLWLAQTPQAFNFKDILTAHRLSVGFDFTDDAAIAESAGLNVAIINGEEGNYKITTENDLARARGDLALNMTGIRVGTGFDVHRFGPGDHVTLCGVRVPFQAGLIGHSDGDVGIHAVVDALLGAISAGDIGHYFPSTEELWKNADSKTFLSKAALKVRELGGHINHIDVTLICNRPKISDFKIAMAQQMAEILEIPINRVSIKATTTDGLGFTGRGEGIAAQALATINLAHEENRTPFI